MTGAATPALSVVVPVYNEEKNVAPLFGEIRDVMRAIGQPFEVIFVNDGSSDGTLEQLRRQMVGEPRLRVLDLDGNFGEAAALSAGFGAARGELVVTLDGDGQNDPHDIPHLLKTLERGGYRVVSGWRQERQEGLLLRVLPSRLANRLIAAVTRIPVHDHGCGLKVYQRAMLRHTALPRGMNRFLPAILGVSAGEVAEVPVNDRRRVHGQSHYGISRTLIVLRDLLAVRFIIRSPRVGESAWRAVMIVSVAAAVGAAQRHHPVLSVALAVLCIVAVVIWWNLRRFNRAQRDGVYRVRREYTAEEERAVLEPTGRVA